MRDDVVVSSSTVVNSLWWKILERLTSQGLNLVIQIVLARLLLPEDFGNLAIISSIIGYCTVFVQSGLSTVIVQKNNLEKDDVSTMLVSSLGIALVLYLFLFWGASYISRLYDTDELVWPLRIQSLILFLGAVNSIQVALFSRVMQFKAIFFRSILSVPISGFIGIAMALGGYGIWALIAQSIASYLITIIYMSFNPLAQLNWGFKWERAKKMYAFSGKILLSGLVSTTGDTVRTMLIGKKYNAKALGYYDKGYSYSSLVTQIITLSMTSVMLPVFSRKQTDKQEVLRMARKSVGLTSFFMVPVLFAVIGMAEPFVILVLSEKWSPCIPFLMIFCLLRLPCCITNIDKQVYYALGNSSVGLYYELFLLVANIIMLIITVPISIMAIAVGATIVEFLGFIILVFYSHYYFDYKILDRFRDLFKPIINSTVMLGGMLLLNTIDASYGIKLVVQLLAAIVIYSTGVAVLRDKNAIYIYQIFKSKLSK